jgi:hypothetical protein
LSRWITMSPATVDKTLGNNWQCAMEYNHGVITTLVLSKDFKNNAPSWCAGSFDHVSIYILDCSIGVGMQQAPMGTRFSRHGERTTPPWSKNIICVLSTPWKSAHS